VKGSSICKTCYDAYKRDQFCIYCQQIYVDDTTTASNDDKDWVGCEDCGRWNHIECEAENGQKNIKQLVDGKKDYKYFCPDCKGKNPTKPNPKNPRAQGANAGGRASGSASGATNRGFLANKNNIYARPTG